MGRGREETSSARLDGTSLRGHDAIVTMLLNRATADVKATVHSGYTPLLLAITSENLQSVKHLIKAGANVNCRISGIGTPLTIAIAFERHSIAKCVLDAPDIDVILPRRYAMSPLLQAAETGNLAILGLLLTMVTRRNEACQLGWTALLCAVEFGKELIVKTPPTGRY